MKTFLEHWSKWDPKDRSQEYEHETYVGSRRVRIMFEPHRDSRGSYEVHYSVDGLGRKRREDNAIQDHEGLPILHHVKKKVEQFIRGARPKSLEFFSPNEDKQALHRYLSRHLIKKYRGEEIVSSDAKKQAGARDVVSFPAHRKYWK